MKNTLLLLATLLCSLSFTYGDEMTDAVLAEMNLARTQPRVYAAIIQQEMGKNPAMAADVAEAVRFLDRQRPMGPLTRLSGLDAAAKLHVDTLGPKGGVGHGVPSARISRYGKWSGQVGEAIYYGRRSARGLVCALIVDHKVPDRGHRKSIFTNAYMVVGLSYGAHAKFGSMCVIDFASGFIGREGVIAAL